MKRASVYFSLLATLVTGSMLVLAAWLMVPSTLALLLPKMHASISSMVMIHVFPIFVALAPLTWYLCLQQDHDHLPWESMLTMSCFLAMALILMSYAMVHHAGLHQWVQHYFAHPVLAIMGIGCCVSSVVLGIVSLIDGDVQPVSTPSDDKAGILLGDGLKPEFVPVSELLRVHDAKPKHAARYDCR